MNCPITDKPTITNLKEKYSEFSLSWTTSIKDLIIREALEQLNPGELYLRGLKSICKKRWNFISECEYDVVVKDISRRFSDTKYKYVSEFSSKFPKMFNKINSCPKIDRFMSTNPQKTAEQTFKLPFDLYGSCFDLTEEKLKKVFDYVVELNRSTFFS
jgi:hypothetical protein